MYGEQRERQEFWSSLRADRAVQIAGEAPTVTSANAACHRLWGWRKRCRPNSPSAAALEFRVSEACSVITLLSSICSRNETQIAGGIGVLDNPTAGLSADPTLVPYRFGALT